MPHLPTSMKEDERKGGELQATTTKQQNKFIKARKPQSLKCTMPTAHNCTKTL